MPLLRYLHKISILKLIPRICFDILAIHNNGFPVFNVIIRFIFFCNNKNRTESAFYAHIIPTCY